MKKIFLLVIGGALTIGTFAIVTGKDKNSKKNKANSSQHCPANCSKSMCIKM